MPAIQNAFRSHFYIISCLLLLVVTLVIDEVIFADNKRRVDPKETITQSLWNELDVLDERLDDISNRAIVDLNRVFNRFNEDDIFPYYIFEDGELIYWSTDRFVPKYGTFEGTYLYKYLKLKSGEYIVKRRVLNSGQNRIVEVYELLPLYSDIPISNNFRRNGLNSRVFGKTEYKLSSTQAENESNRIYSREGIYLFSFSGAEAMKIEYPTYSVFILLLFFMVILFFIMAGYRYARQLDEGGKAYLGVIVLSAFFFLLRWVMITYEFPLSVMDLDLFEPEFFASSIWQPSLGDFVLNQLCLMGVVMFGYRSYSKRQKVKEVASVWDLAILLVLSLGSLIYFELEVESLLHNSQWSLDIAQDISLSPFRIISYLLLFINGVMCFLVAQLASKEILLVPKPAAVITGLLTIAAGSLTLFLWLGNSLTFILLLWSLYLLIVYRMKLADQINSVSYNTFLYFFLASFLIAAISDFVLMRHISGLDRQEKLSLATELLTENDLTAEFLLSRAGEEIGGDVLIQTGISNPFTPKGSVRLTIRQTYLGDYFDKYDIEILLYNGYGNAISNPNALDYEALREIYATPEYSTEYDNLFFVNDRFINQYYLFSEVRRYGNVIGYVVVKLDRKEQLNNSILPRLLFEDPSFNPATGHFDYGIYRDGQLISSVGDYNYRRDFALATHDSTLLFEEGVLEDNYRHLAVAGRSTGEFFVISSHVYPIRYIITNFAIFFLSLVVMIILIFLISAIFYNTRNKGVSISAKIQILLNFAFFLPLIIVSIVVLRLVNDTVRRNIETEYLDVTESAGQNLSTTLENFLESQNANNETLESRVSEISQYSRADINLFNTNGRLVATNQRLIFENQILSSYTNPGAMASIVERGNNKSIFEEFVGDLTYQATYYGIRSNEDNRLIGILSIPFFESQEQLKRQQTDILSNILNAFTFIFIVFVILSFLASRILTYPFKYLTQKIKTTTLSKYNEPLEWAADDEIGLMVKEYNSMLVNLEKSKKALALSEKESAWREMAQQVAHEIKNPLTPMKLKLQHLKRVLAAGQNLEQNHNKPIDSLLGQVEILSDIATSFSSFAKMPIPLSERLDVADVLKKATRLFSAEEVEINANIPRNPVWIEGDKNLLGRIFNNLILNAIQSVPDGKKAKLEVELELTSTRARISVSDNGAGIGEDIKEKIFIPKFSTKEKGSGIGLAIAKRGVEHAGGSIWFESETGQGTTFFIEFPLMD